MSQASCPLCSSHRLSPIADTFYRCKNCTAVINGEYQTIEYTEDYFLDDYKAQYGKTYLDDFPVIYERSRERIEYICSLPLEKEKRDIRMLDIGSAMGFFLKAARDMDIAHVEGIEISQYASRFTEKEFGIPVRNTPFDQMNAGEEEEWDVITAWFFIEHTADPRGLVYKIYNLLRNDGVFAFSVPSAFGPMFQWKRSDWLKTHPVDHFVDFTPKAARKLLKTVGFKSVKVRPAAYHPERLLDESSLFFPVFRKLYRVFSSLTGFSDTLEIYAVK